MEIENQNCRLESGYTLLEILLAVSIGVTFLMGFFQGIRMILIARDKYQANQDIIDTQTQIISFLNQIGQTAEQIDISTDGTQLQVIGTPCRLFVWDDTSFNLGYAEDDSLSCSVPLSPLVNLNSSTIEVINLVFTGIPDNNDAKSLKVNFTLKSVKPFVEQTKSFTTSVTLWKK